MKTFRSLLLLVFVMVSVCTIAQNPKKFYKTVGLEYYSYQDFVNRDNIKKISEKIRNISVVECKNYTYKDIEVGKHAIISANRYFKGYVSSEELYNKILRDELINAIISTNVAEGVIEKEKPDVLVTSHGCYSSWGSFSDYFTNQGIRICVWASGEQNTVTFDRYRSDEYFKKYLEENREKKPLDENEEKELDNFLKKELKEKRDKLLFMDLRRLKKRFSKKNLTLISIKKHMLCFQMFPGMQL